MKFNTVNRTTIKIMGLKIGVLSIPVLKLGAPRGWKWYFCFMFSCNNFCSSSSFPWYLNRIILTTKQSLELKMGEYFYRSWSKRPKWADIGSFILPCKERLFFVQFWCILKPLGQMVPNLAGSIYLRSFISFLISSDRTTNMAAMGNSCYWLAGISKISSETTWLNGIKLYRKHLYKILYQVSSFRPNLTRNMAAWSNSCFWLADISNIFSETTWQNGTKLYRKHLREVLYKVSSFCPDHHESSFVCLSLTFHILIFFETTGPLCTKLWQGWSLGFPFQNYVRWPRTPTKMVAMAENRKFSQKNH